MLAAASIPVKAITAIGSAKARSDPVGAVPRWMLELRACGVEHQGQPEHDDHRLEDQVGDGDQQPRAQPARADAGQVVGRHTAITARATAISSPPRPIGAQNAAR